VPVMSKSVSTSFRPAGFTSERESRPTSDPLSVRASRVTPVRAVIGRRPSG
jgi:hypothetical protein